MTYATKQDLIDRADAGEQTLVELTDRADPPTGLIEDTVVTKALGDADAVINSYLQSRYVLPLASVPTVLTRCATDIALYDLYGTRAPDGLTARYNAAMKWLMALSKGDVGLGLDAALQPTTASGGGAQVASVDRVITSDSMAGYEPA